MTTLKPFDLEKARAGDPVVTRDGRKVRIICSDAVNNDYPIIGLIQDIKGEGMIEETSESFTKYGRHMHEYISELDLFMATKTKIYLTNIYSTHNGIIVSGRVVENEDSAKSEIEIYNRNFYKFIKTISFEIDEE